MRTDSAGRARLALCVLPASVLVPLVAAGLRSVLWALVGVAGPAAVSLTGESSRGPSPFTACAARGGRPMVCSHVAISEAA